MVLAHTAIYTYEYIWGSLPTDVFAVYLCCTCGRYVKTNGEVRMQKDLSRERTSYRSLAVPCDERIAVISCRKLIVWAVSEHRKILVRHGVRKGTEEGCSWRHLEGSVAQR